MKILGKSHLVIPDSHCHKGDNLRRFKWLGQFIVEKKPDVIVNLGDFWDMGSLCSYDKGKRDFIFKNVADDIESGHEAETLLYGPLIDYNKQMIRNKQKQYNPVIIKLLGNHEDRVRKLLEYEPRWDGSVSMESFKTKLALNEKVVPYQDYVEQDGVYYSHCWASGVLGKPVGSARALVMKKGVSCTQGHSHFLDHSLLIRPDGTLIRGLIAGCFLDKDYKGFGGPQVDNIYWKGVIYKTNVNNGGYDLEEISIQRLEEMYT